MEFSLWDLALIFARLVIYVGVCAIVGGEFIHWMCKPYLDLRKSIRRYSIGFTGIAIVASASEFFIQVGAFSESGLAGIWDSDVVAILWESNIGDTTLLRICGFSAVLFSVSFQLISSVGNANRDRLKIGQMLLYLLGVVLIARSFSLIGHSAEMTAVSQLMLSAHVVLVAWWMGALWPLLKSCYLLEAKPLHHLMHRFGQYAAFLVAVLLLCGGGLAYQIFDSFHMLFFTTYGQVFLIKISSVIVILLLAAMHKFRLVPALRENDLGKGRLALSIKVEMALGLAILIVTTVITTLVGPEHSM